jgi:glycosyltransferase involved in cell wall biosynthesis
VVATRVGGVPDVVRDGVDGFLVEPGTTEAAAERLTELARDPVLRKRLGDAGREVRARYSVARLVDDVDRLYRSLLAAKGLPVPSD